MMTKCNCNGYLDLLLEKRTRCRRSVSESWSEREVSSLTPTKPPKGNDLIPGWLVCTGVENEINFKENLRRYCSKKLGTKKATKVGHTALPPHLETKYFLTESALLVWNIAICCVISKYCVYWYKNITYWSAESLFSFILIEAKIGYAPPQCQSQEPPRRKLDPLSQGCRGPWRLVLFEIIIFHL